MRMIPFLVTLSIVPLIALGQPGIDQLRHNLETVKSDKEKIDAYKKIATYYQATQPDSAYYFLNQGIKYFEDKEDKYGEAMLHNKLGAVYSIQGQLDAAVEVQQKAMSLYKQIKDANGQGVTSNLLGVIEGKKGNYTTATRYFVSSMRIFENTRDTAGLISTYMKMGIVDGLNSNHSKSIEWYNKAEGLLRKGIDNKNATDLYNNFGNTYGRMAKYGDAQKYFLKSLDLCQSEQERGPILANLANTYKLQGDTGTAMKYYNEALALSVKYKVPEEQARLILNITSITARYDLIKAMSLLKEAFAITQWHDLKLLQTEVLQGMIEIRKEKGEYKDAFELLVQKHKILDSIYNLEKAREIANMQSTYELDKSNSKLKDMVAAERKASRTQNIIVIIAVGLGAALLTLAYTFSRTRKLNMLLAKRKAELVRANIDKDRLFSIIGHDLKGPVNNIPVVIDLLNTESTNKEEREFLLSSLRENAVATADTLDKLLNWGKSQIKGISMHQKTFIANDSLADNIALLKPAANAKQITIENNVPEGVVIYADEEHFRFISRNLLANAIKFTGVNGELEINVDDKMKPGFVVFSVKDNGVGVEKAQLEHLFDSFGVSTTGTANEAGHSIGLMLCREFVNENGGEIWVESKKGVGSVFYFSLKKTA